MMPLTPADHFHKTLFTKDAPPKLLVNKTDKQIQSFYRDLST